jgi:hypothetical protein
MKRLLYIEGMNVDSTTMPGFNLCPMWLSFINYFLASVDFIDKHFYDSMIRCIEHAFTRNTTTENME